MKNNNSAIELQILKKAASDVLKWEFLIDIPCLHAVIYILQFFCYKNAAFLLLKNIFCISDLKTSNVANRQQQYNYFI